MEDGHRAVLRQWYVYNPCTKESKPILSFIFMFQQDLRAQTYAILESLHLEKRAGTEDAEKDGTCGRGAGGV